MSSFFLIFRRKKFRIFFSSMARASEPPNLKDCGSRFWVLQDHGEWQTRPWVFVTDCEGSLPERSCRVTTSQLPPPWPGGPAPPLSALSPFTFAPLLPWHRPNPHGSRKDVRQGLGCTPCGWRPCAPSSSLGPAFPRRQPCSNHCCKKRHQTKAKRYASKKNMKAPFRPSFLVTLLFRPHQTY